MAPRSSGRGAAFVISAFLLAVPEAIAADSPADAGTPGPVASEQLVREAETAYAELRRIADLGEGEVAGDLPERISRVERRLADLRSARLLASAGAALEDQFQEAIEVNRWDEQLAEQGERLAGSRASLRRLIETWRLTVASLGAEAPPALVARAVEIRDRASALEEAVRKRLSATLELQDRVLALKLSAADLFRRVRAADAARRRELFEIESTPLWRAFGKGAPLFTVGRLRALELQGRTCYRYLSAAPGRSVLHLVLFAVLAFTGLAVVRRLPRDPPVPGPAPDPIEVVSKHPIATATVLALLATPLVHPSSPTPFVVLLFLLGLGPFFRLASTLASPWKRRLRLLAVLFVAQRLVAGAPDLALLGRLLLLAIDVVAFATCAAALRRGGIARIAGGGRLGKAMAAAGAAACGLFAISAVANVFGNVILSEFLAGATLASACAAVLAAASATLFTGMLRAAFLLPQVRDLRFVREHQMRLDRWASGLFRAASTVTWAYWTLRAFRLMEPFGKAASGTLAARLEVGALNVSLRDVAAFGVTLWLAVWLTRGLRFALDEALLPALGVTRGRADAISTTTQYVVFALGFSFAVLAAGMDVTRFTVLLGTLGVGIGFGLQGLVNNFVSGLVLLYEQPVQVDDVIEIGRLVGKVQRIGIRSSTLRTFDGADVIVPNSNIISAEVINWTRSDQKRRVDVKIGVAYGTDPRHISETLLATTRSFPGVHATPEPVALFTGFGDSALEFEVRFWASVDDWVTIASGLRAALNDSLSRAGIEVPFPQLDLRVRSVPAPTEKAKTVPGVGRIEPPSLSR